MKSGITLEELMVGLEESETNPDTRKELLASPQGRGTSSTNLSLC